MSKHHSVIRFAPTAILAVMIAGPIAGIVRADADDVPRVFVYVGTYASDAEKGIHVFRLDGDSGELTAVGAVSGIKNPSFQAIHPNGKFLYSVSESNEFQDQQGGSITALAIDADTGMLKTLNAQASMGAGPCHLAVDRAGKHVLAANYGGGSVVVLPILPDGSLRMACCFIQHEGASIHPRQTAPRAHCINVDANDRFVVSADLGIDQVVIYRYDNRRGLLVRNPSLPAVAVEPGSGPRHFAFHPSNPFAYVINELSSTITTFRYDADRGELSVTDVVSTLPDDFDRNKNTTAEIAVAPNGRFLYGSNRGHNSIAVYALDAATGKPTLVAHCPTLGEMPRNFAIDPTGTFLLAANQRTGNVVVFRIDRETGALAATGHSVSLPTPVCVTFLAVPGSAAAR